MTDAVLIVPPGFRLLDTSGNPVVGGTYNFYAAGTTTPLTVYSDDTLSTPLGTSVATDSGGYAVNGSGTKTTMYTGSADYKVVIKDSLGNTLVTHDNVKGAVTGGSGSGTFAKPATPVDTGAATVTLTISDLGKVKNLNPTSAAITVVLPSAVDAGNATSQSNWVTIRHIGTANSISVVAVSGQTIDGGGLKTVSSQYDSVTLCSDGANWHQIAFSRASLSSGAITSDLLDTRVVGGLATVGDIKLIASETVPTGWLECNGQAVSRTTYAALYAKIGVTHGQGDGATTFNVPDYRGRFLRIWDHGAGRDPDAASRTAMATGGQTGDHVGSVQTDQYKSHTHTMPNAGYVGALAAISGGSLSVPDGNHTGTTGSSGGNETRPTNANVMAIIMADPAAAAGAANALNTIYNGAGAPSSGTGINGDFYIDTTNNRLYGPKAAGAWSGYVSIVGPTGATGSTGAAGADAGWSYTWSTNTSATDPGSGGIKVNNATLASATALYISETNADSASIAAEIATWDDGTSTVKGTLKISKSGASANFVIYQITGTLTDNGAWDTLAVTYVTSAGTISNGDSVKVNFIRAGDVGATGGTGLTGATGASGPVPIDYTWDTGTSAADPGSGKLRANNATLSSATAIYINETDRLGNALATFIQQWDDSTNTTKGQLIVIDTTNPANRVYFNITGTITDNGSYETITVNYASGVTSLSAVNVALMFVRSGDKGADGAGTVSGLTAGQLAIAGGASSITSSIAYNTAPTASTIAEFDANANLSAANHLEGYATTATAAATTTLTVASKYQQFFTGSTTQTVAMPVTSTLVLGQSWLLVNLSTGAITVQSSGGNTIIILAANTTAVLTCVSTSGTGAASWNAQYWGGIFTSGKSLSVSNSLTLAGTDGTTMTFPGTSSTVLTTGNNATITKGYYVTPNNIGTVSSGTTTPDAANGNYQYYTNNGAHTLAAPSNDCAVDILVTNGASAGNISFSGFTTGSNVGDSLDQTNAHKFIISIRRINGTSTYVIKALQ